MYEEKILTEYEDFLNKVFISENGKYTLEEMLHINEARGVIFNLRGICDAMYKCIGPVGWIKQKDGSYVNTFPKINARGSFLKDLTLIVRLVPSDTEIETGGEVNLTNAIIDRKTKKMMGIVIEYTDYLNSDFEVNRIEFYKSMWHELQHAYRKYQMLLAELTEKGPRKPDNGNAINLKHYNNAMKYGVDVGKYFNVRNFFYLSDKNEIDSFFHEMVPYIQEHKEINFTNVKEYLESIPGYNVVKILKFFANNFYVVEQDEQLRNELTVQCRKIFENDKMTVSQCVYRTKNRVQNAALYAVKQFYKILGTVLKKFKRKGYYSESLIKKELDINEMLDNILES